LEETLGASLVQPPAKSRISAEFGTGLWASAIRILKTSQPVGPCKSPGMEIA